ncbi:MAG: hypothetical protein H7124_00055 [Phycisphaerales bacterium]|nr:hypothetical protein [Hyphomonadaceae bacterium]
MIARKPWHKRGFWVHKFVYRGWYIGQLLLGGFTLVSALALAIMLALDAIANTLEIVLTAIAAVVTGLISALVLWLAIHRLRNSVKSAL